MNSPIAKVNVWLLPGLARSAFVRALLQNMMTQVADLSRSKPNPRVRLQAAEGEGRIGTLPRFPGEEAGKPPGCAVASGLLCVPGRNDVMDLVEP